MVAYKDTKRNAKKLGLSFWDYVIQGHKPSVNVVLLEDIAAVLGVFIAGTCMTITYYTGNHVADCVGSLLVGCVMGGVASFIVVNRYAHFAYFSISNLIYLYFFLLSIVHKHDGSCGKVIVDAQTNSNIQLLFVVLLYFI